MKLFLLLAFLPVVLAFDYYIYATTWAPTFCRVNPDKCVEKPIQNFIIHGLWPQNDSSYPQFCQPCEPFAKWQLQPLENELKEYWSDTGKIDWVFLEHEWDKHGCCSFMSQKDYFTSVIELRKKWDYKKVFQSVDMHPNTTVILSRIKSAAQNFCGNRCTVAFNCINNRLMSMYMSLAKNFSVDEKTISDDCSKEFLW